MDRLKEKLCSARNALNTLQELVGIVDISLIQRDAAIQRFEYTFEATWKAAKLYLKEFEGIDVASPKGVVRACMQVGVFDELQTRHALDMVDDRNLTSHTYNEGLAESIYSHLKTYADIFDHWIFKMMEFTGHKES